MHHRAFNLFSVKCETVLRASLVLAAAVAFLAIVVALVAMPTAVLAQTSTWTGASSINWNTTFNWSPNGVPTTASDVVFPAGVFITAPLLTANGTAASLLFDSKATSYALSSNAGVSLSGVRSIALSDTTTATQTIDLANIATGNLLFPIGQNLTITNNAAATAASAPTLIIGPNTVIGTPGFGGVVFGGMGTTNVSGSFANTAPPNNQVQGGLTKNGSGILVLSGSGTNLAGGFAFNGGTLRLDYSTNTASKLGGGGLTSAGGDLVLVPHATTAITQNFASTSLTAGHTEFNVSQLAALPTLNLGAITRSAGATMNFSGSFMGVFSSAGNTNGLLGTGPAFATVDGSFWVEQAGVVIEVVVGDPMIGPGQNTNLNISQSLTSDLTNSLRFAADNLTLSISGVLSLQSGGILAPTGITGSVITGGSLVVPLDGQFLVHAYGPLTINSALVSSAGLTKTGTETLTLGANNFNAGFAGPITIQRGGLRFTNAGAAANASAINFNDNAARGDGAQTLTIEHGDDLFSGIGLGPSIRFSASANGPNVFPNVITTGVNNNATVVIDGVISSAPGTATPIRFDGQGNDSSGFILHGNNTFTGAVELRNGSLGIVSNANLGNPANPLSLNTGNALGGGLGFQASGIDLARPVHVASSARITSNGTDVNTISGPLSGSSFLFKAGTGTLAVTGPSTFTGELRIEAGTLRANAAFLAATGPIKVRNAAVLAVAETASLPAAGQIILGTFSTGPGVSTIDVAAAATFTVNGGLSDESGAAPTLVKTGPGTLVLNPSASTYSGGTTVRNGELRAAADASLGAASGPVTVEPAGMLTFTGSTSTSRNYTLHGGRLGTLAGQTLAFANATVSGGFLFGQGAFATQEGTTNTFVGTTSFSGSSIALAGLDDLIAYTNGGLLTKAPGQSAALTQFTNTSSGRIVVNGGVFAAEFVSNGQIDVSAAGVIQHVGNSNLVLGGGSRTFVGSAANPGGSISIMGSSTLELNGALLVNNGTITGTTNINYGSLAAGSGAFGVVNVNQGGVFAPGNNPGISTAAAVNFDNSVTSAAPVLAIELGGTMPGTQYDRLHVTGNLSLGGTLAVSLIDTGAVLFEPEEGDSFDILNWASLTGAFSAIQLPTLVGDLTWNTDLLYTTGELRVVSPGVSGDFNLDGSVDAADYIVWRKGVSVAPTPVNYNIWRANFGQTSGSGSVAGANATVPEPATWVTLIFAVAGWWLQKHRAE